MAAKKDDKDPITHNVEQGVEDMAELNRRQAEQARSLLGAGTRLYSDMGDVGRGDVESLIETGARLAKGAQDVSWEMMHYTQQSMQMGMRCANELMTCRTVEDMLKVQRNFIRQSMDSLLQESVKLLELSTGTAQSAANEIQQRMETRQ